MSASALLAVTPALPLHEAGKYVAAAYTVAFLLVLVYVAIMALRLTRVERELGELLELSQDHAPDVRSPASAPASSAEDASGTQALAAGPSQPVGARVE